MGDDGQARRAVSTHEPVATVARQVRASLRALLTGWGMASDVVEDALLVVEELVANAIDHARTNFRLVVQLTGEVLRVAVDDRASGLPQVRPFDPAADRGRGLQVVAKLALRWGCEANESGKTVWADLAAT